MDLKTVQTLLAEHSITKIKVGGFDIDGVLRGKYISRDKFDSAAETGLGFCDVIFGWDSSDALYDNVKVTGWHTGYPDALARIDLSTFRVIPWEPGTAFFILDFYDGAGNPLPVSPRQALERVIAQAQSMGFAAQMSAEYEFFLFKEDSHSIRQKHYRDMVPLSPGMFGYSVLRTGVFSELAHTIIDAMRAFDVELEGFHTETGPGVYETAIKYRTCPAAAGTSTRASGIASSRRTCSTTPRARTRCRSSCGITSPGNSGSCRSSPPSSARPSIRTSG